MNRREFLSDCGKAALVGTLARGMAIPFRRAADYTLHIASLELELAPGKTVRTTAYNGMVPGPVIRLREGAAATIDVVNDTDREEFVHWHGLEIPSDVDGAMDEGTPAIPAHGRNSYSFVPRPAGTRWYHSHATAGRDFTRSTYSGQFGFLMIDPASEPGRYDQEVFLAMHDWGPYIMGGDDGFQSVGYNHASINARLLGSGEPIRVKENERVLVHVLNASASEAHWLALPGHQFTVLALDGNAVGQSASVDQLLLNPGERVDAIIEMRQPGVWILGEPRDHVRDMGLGVVVEYAGKTGAPQWVRPPGLRWSYVDFSGRATATGVGAGVASAPGAVQRIPLVFRSEFRGHGAFEHWTINGKSYPKTDVLSLT
ncbi:MAG TPA: multicopper oxidase domain-containing protein, partial [Gemmatimonadaceae bacterium]|nr:multicopper oxidase domain-containing protein [Gemmatimonadaceae bacterium]